MEPIVSGVGVIDKAMLVVSALEQGPHSLAEVQAATGLSRATAHRLAAALEAHGVVARDGEGRYVLGVRLVGLGEAVATRFPWWDTAWPILTQLRNDTGEGVQLFVREGDRRVCVISLESSHRLRWIVPMGAVLPLDRGSAGRVLRPDPPPAPRPLRASAGDSPANRRPTWVESVEEREVGVASVSAPVRDDEGKVVAAVSVSGPLERLSRAPGRRYGAQVVQAALDVEAAAGLRP